MTFLRTLGAFLLAVAAVVAQDSAPAPMAWVRKGGDGASIKSLEVALRDFRREDGTTVTLVGVAHIGNPDFYVELKKRLDAFDVVLYESVLPDGATTPEGSTEDERRAATLRSLEFLGSMASRMRTATGAWPESPAALEAWVRPEDPRLAHGVRYASTDAWGHAVSFAPRETGLALRTTPPSGQDPMEFVQALPTSRPASSPASRRAPKAKSNLQKDLATALGLAYQLDVIDYGRPSFVLADATLGDVRRGMKAAGGSFDRIEQALTGSGGMGALLGMMVNLLKVSGDDTKDSVKGMLIDVLATADERMIDALGKSTNDVLIGMRNQSVFRRLDALLAGDRRPRSVAIFYGAAHLADMAQRLHERGFQSQSTVWLTALTAPADKDGKGLSDRLLKNSGRAASRPRGN